MEKRSRNKGDKLRSMIGPIISIGIIAILITFLIILNQEWILIEDIRNETINDINWHKSNIQKIYSLSEINDVYYKCGQMYNCTNTTLFLIELNSCAHSKGYKYNVVYDGEFYIYINGFKDILSKKYLC